MTLGEVHFRVLAAMRSHGSLTVRSFSHSPTIDGGGEFDRLPARIEELREAGYAIETVMETTARGKRYGRYFLRGEPEVSGASSTPVHPDGADLKTQGAASEAVEQPSLFDIPAPSPYRDAA